MHPSHGQINPASQLKIMADKRRDGALAQQLSVALGGVGAVNNIAELGPLADDFTR
jgi:hypothetical protein